MLNNRHSLRDMLVLSCLCWLKVLLLPSAFPLLERAVTFSHLYLRVHIPDSSRRQCMQLVLIFRDQ